LLLPEEQTVEAAEPSKKKVLSEFGKQWKEDCLRFSRPKSVHVVVAVLHQTSSSPEQWIISPLQLFSFMVVQVKAVGYLVLSTASSFN
jgi:hypothetical protein